MENTLQDSIHRLRETFRYDSETGLVYYSEWYKEYRKNNMRASGRQVSTDIPVGKQESRGYLAACLPAYVLGECKNKRLHQIVWALVHGEWPPSDGSLVIDHMDGNPSNNRVENLRLVSQKHNTHNRAVRHAGKRLPGTRPTNSAGAKHEAYISMQGPGTKTYLGTYPTEEEAHVVYMIAKAVLHGGYLGRVAHG